MALRRSLFVDSIVYKEQGSARLAIVEASQGESKLTLVLPYSSAKNMKLREIVSLSINTAEDEE